MLLEVKLKTCRQTTPSGPLRAIVSPYLTSRRGNILKKFQNDPKPEIFRIEELVTRVRIGDIKLPKFQRPFIWNRKDVLKLWDSIYNGYPVGSILLWLTMQRLASEKRIGDLDINIRPDEYPTNYLLDGQQRLSTLCGALFWNGEDKDSMWNISFDLTKEQFVFPKDELKFEHFPLNKLIDTSDFLNQCKTFEGRPEKVNYFAKATALLNSIKDYKIAAVTIGDMKINEVAPIFERINSTGRRLTIYDLMRAATWSGDFDLNDTVKSIRDSLRQKAFENVPETHILRNISASAGYGINKLDIESLRDKKSEELQDAANACVEAYRLAVDFLTDELPISSHAYLPYALQLTHLVEFFRLKRSPTMEQREKLRKWLWRTSLSRYFSSANTTQNASDLEKMRDFAKGKSSDLELDRGINYKAFVSDTFSLNKAASKTFALLLAHQGPRRLLDGSPINTYQALAVVNRHEYHHIFPQAYLKSSGVPQSDIDVHANICLLNKGNNLTISNQRPSVYFKELDVQLGSNLEDVLASNLISMDAYQAGLQDDYLGFLELRSALIIELAKKLVGNVPEVTSENGETYVPENDETDTDEE